MMQYWASSTCDIGFTFDDLESRIHMRYKAVAFASLIICMQLTIYCCIFFRFAFQAKIFHPTKSQCGIVVNPNGSDENLGELVNLVEGKITAKLADIENEDKRFGDQPLDAFITSLQKVIFISTNLK